MSSFELKGLEELQKDLEAAREQFPKKTNTFLNKQARAFKKACNEKFPKEGTSGNKPIAKKWRTSRVKDGAGGIMEIELTNKSPIFHLVENGHIGMIPTGIEAPYIKHGSKSSKLKNKKAGRKPKMKYIGFVPGRHYCRQTREEFQEKLPEEAGAFLNELLKERKL